MQPCDDSRQALRETITAEEAAAIVGLSTWTIYNLARQRQIPCIRIGCRRVLFRRSSILAWLEAQEAASIQEKEPAPEKIRRVK